MSARVEIAAGHWLDAPAAASYFRMLAAGMPRGGITDAGRTYAQQQVMYARYLRGELLATAARPGTSKHEKGNALDLSGAAREWVRSHGRQFGWLIDQVAREPWHMEYAISLDRRLFATPEPVVSATPMRVREDTVKTVTYGGRTYVVTATSIQEVSGAQAVVATTLWGAPVGLDSTGWTALVQTVEKIITDTRKNLGGAA